MKRQLAHLIEKNRSLVRLFEKPRVVGHRPGEGAAHVSEELALHQGFGNRATVDCDERPFFPRPVEMNRAGHEFFAGAAFPGDQHIGVARRNFSDELIDLFDAAALADDTLELKILHLPARGARAQLLWPDAVPLRGAPFLRFVSAW